MIVQERLAKLDALDSLDASLPADMDVSGLNLGDTLSEAGRCVLWTTLTSHSSIVTLA